MYNEIIAALEQAAKDDSKFAVFTGAGDFYCSGNDLSNFTKIPEGGVQEMARQGAELLRWAIFEVPLSLCSYPGPGNGHLGARQSLFYSDNIFVLLRKYVRAYIDFPKPLVAVVNGPAVGISVTVLGLFDLVYATERVQKHTPWAYLLCLWRVQGK
ncbi:hypothetical protein XENOCAPTIV_007044 [Xenoophorus captivus]|uniref:Uncharacterized protein n=1 Tax=Xenoophorus captivus TaxID=1517983 RepID=A0ABV0S037_9TELE